MTKAITLLTLLACPLHAALIARVQTTLGTVDVELQFTTAPKAVANFMTLAQGTRARVHPVTGAVTNAPLYVGEKFFRTANNATYKFAQTGSGTGDGKGTTGYTFKDEFTPAMRHTGYTLSSANAGPNTNNGQIFLTGNISIPAYDDIHTIIGRIPDPTSRAVVDLIIGAGDNGSTITGISFLRTDPAAVSFNELAQGLPEVVKPGGSLQVTPGIASLWNFDTPITGGSIFRAYRSTSLNNDWQELEDAQLQLGILPHPQNASASQVLLETSPGPRGFYHLSLARHPGAVGPATLANRTVAIPLDNDLLTYAFNAAGNGGTLTYTPASGSPFSTPFTTRSPESLGEAAPYSLGSHNINFVSDAPNLNPRYFWVRIGCDSATTTTISAHCLMDTLGFFGWEPFAMGSCSITR